MTNPPLILIYLTCHSTDEAKIIGDSLLSARLIGCYNILGDILAKYWWPAKKNVMETSQEIVIILKTIPQNFSQVESEVKKLHSDKTICLLAIPIYQVNEDYANWIKEEINIVVT